MLAACSESPSRSPERRPAGLQVRERPDGIGEQRFRIDDHGDYRLFAQVRVDRFLHTVPVELTVERSA